MRRLVVCALLVGCSNDGDIPDATTEPLPPGWWQPKPGEVTNWDLQTAAPYDLSAPRTMYLLDLFALVPNPILLDYQNGAPTLVPVGALAGKLDELHARNPKSIVICALDTGVLDLSSPDAPRFPGYAASPPDDPDLPADGSVIGWSFAPNVRVLDIRPASRDAFASLIWKRLDLAKQIGCDGVAPRHNNPGLGHGFTIAYPDVVSWFQEVGQQAHQRRLSVGMTDATTEVVDAGSDFDWLLESDCGLTDDCHDFVAPFITAQKAVLGVDVVPNDSGLDATTICMNQIRAGILDGIVKSPELDSTMRVQCGM